MKLISNVNRRSIHPKGYFVEDSTPINMHYDDEVPGIGSVEGKDTSERDFEILSLLEKIEKKLTKLEGMLEQVVAPERAQQIPQEPQEPQTAFTESMCTPAVTKRGSMLSEIQEALAQQGGIQPAIGVGGSQTSPVEDNSVSSIATLPASIYDDDIGEIESYQ